MPDIKIGDTVAWADVPDGAMVRTATRQAGVVHALRIVGHGRFVSGTWGWREWDLRWEWSAEAEAPAWLKHPDPTIIALGLTGFEAAEDLQRLAEVFDGWRAGLPFVADLARAASDPCAACAEMDGWGCREHQSAAVAPAAPGSTGGLEP